MVSAVKIDGKRLHELAREGIEVEREAAPGHRAPLRRRAERASPWCYRDRGRLLVGHLRPHARRRPRPRARRRRPPADLRRTAIGSFTARRGPAARGAAVEVLLTPAEALRDLPSVVVDDEVAADVRHGKVLERRAPRRRAATGPWAVLDEAGELLAVYEPHRGTAQAAVVLACSRTARRSRRAGCRCCTTSASCPRPAAGHAWSRSAPTTACTAATRRVIAGCGAGPPSAGMASAVVTFDRHPAASCGPSRRRSLLTDLDQKLELLAATGVDYTLVIHFDEARSKEPAEDFVREVLVGCLSAKVVVVGEDFHFGHQRQGNVALLERDGRATSASRSPGLELVGVDGSRRRRAEGRVVHRHPHAARRRATSHAANALLGRPHEVRGVVGHGDERGRELGFPTANVDVPDDILLPADGIYAGWYERPDGDRHAAAHLPRPPAHVLRRRRTQPARGPPPRLRRRPLRRARQGRFVHASAAR